MRSILLALLALMSGMAALPAWAACDLAVGTAVAEAAGPVTLHVPAPAVEPRPLLVLLHGSYGRGAAILKSSGLGAAADRNGFIVAAPDAAIVAGEGFVWNIPGVATVTGALPPAGARDDVAYLQAMVAALVARGCVDPARVYVTGISGGGRMASWLGCVAADRYAAIAPVVGLRAGRPLAGDIARVDPATCRPVRAMPVLAFAGDADTTNPIAGGGAAYWGYSMHAAEGRWAQLNGCRTAPVTHWVSAGVYEERYEGCRDGASVVARVTVGAGHVWAADNDALWRGVMGFRRVGARW